MVYDIRTALLPFHEPHGMPQFFPMSVPSEKTKAALSENPMENNRSLLAPTQHAPLKIYMGSADTLSANKQQLRSLIHAPFPHRLAQVKKPLLSEEAL